MQDNSLKLAQAQQAVAEAEQAVEDAEMQLAILNAKPSQAGEGGGVFRACCSRRKSCEALDEQITRLEYQIKSAPDQNMKDRLRQQLSSLKIKSIELES